jgi:hypothetical protein
MDARAESLELKLDDLCEHPFIYRMTKLGMVGLNFSCREEVEPYSDVVYVLSVEARTSLFGGRIRSIQRVVRLLENPSSVEEFPFSPKTIVEISEDALAAKIVSISDLLLIMTREVFEIRIDDKETSFGNLRKLIPSGILPHLGRLADPNRDFRVDRNQRFHSGIEVEFDEFDSGFDFGSLWKERGQNMKIMGPDNKEISLDTLYQARRKALLERAERELLQVIVDVEATLTLLQEVFEERFATKITHENSFMRKVRGQTKT